MLVQEREEVEVMQRNQDKNNFGHVIGALHFPKHPEGERTRLSRWAQVSLEKSRQR
jgi:hypothetical protein